MTVLSRDLWRLRAAKHAERVDAELVEVLARRQQGIAHPVEDFLFDYYTVRPRQLRTWQPGIGVDLEDGAGFGRRRYFRVRDGLATFDGEEFREQRGATVEKAYRLLAAARTRRPHFGCFGMHEWAMVYGLDAESTRHPSLPLRFAPKEVARIVEDVGCRCSHIDAFRFFTPAAAQLNLFQPTLEGQAEHDQPGCLHVNMDLYKWAGKLSPAVSSELLFDTFLLARDIREVDMRASAYDLSGWGLAPVPVETAEGRAEYASLQKAFAEQAEPLRALLVDVARQVLGDDHQQSPEVGREGGSSHVHPGRRDGDG